MALSNRLRLTVTAALILLLLLLTTAVHSADAAPEGLPSPAAGVESGRLAVPGRGPAFVLAVNYEGPADRAWQMWEDGQYDAGLIEADMRRAKGAGFSAVRVFVQPTLVKEVQANNWDKLDTFFAIAQRQGLSVILALYDYADRDLAKVADVDGKIAAHLAGNSALLAYDLKNEPHYSDLAAAVYPGGAKAPIQGNDASQTLKSYQSFIASAGAWVTERNYLVSTLDYMDAPDGRKWDDLLNAVNASLAMWLQPQVDAIRKVDNKHPITVAYSDVALAKLPANSALDYITIHRYPNANGKALAGVSRTMNNLRTTFENKPVLLGEFGFSNDTMSTEESANYEISLYMELLSEGLAGGGKWMLNDFPKGFNAKQNAYGAYTGDGSAKPVIAGVRGLADYLSRNSSPKGELYQPDKQSPNYRWAYDADDALIISAAAYQGTRLSFSADKLSQLFLSWTDPKTMRIYSTSRTDLDMDPAGLVRDSGMGSGYTLARIEANGKTSVPVTVNGSRVKMTLDAGRFYELSLPRSQNAANSARRQDYDVTNGHFYTLAHGRPLGVNGSGFAVTDDGGVSFWSEFQRLGGVDVVGYPVTQRFVLDGFTTQAFQKGVLQWRPEVKQAWFLNTFDAMHDKGLDDWLLTYRQTPKPFDTKPDTGLSWDQVVARHLPILDANPTIKQRFLSNPDWLQQYGLPVASLDAGNSFVVRAQRATFQYWKEDVPWAKKGDVSVANGGDLAKEAYLWPIEAALPQPAPSR
ncbi:MAG TPA: cellulase family glycosylhydrolase [Chloroflexota bacterium]|nr:cellulase family glycosylhydrolase [Chloroflexota bacterium]